MLMSCSRLMGVSEVERERGGGGEGGREKRRRG